LHAGWANSAALRAAGITAATVDPPNGQIQRDEHGQPTGILFEEAQGLVEDAIPHPSAEEDIAAIQTAQARLWSFGLTGVHDFDRLRSFAALQSLHGRGQLKLRVHKNLPVEVLEHAIGIGLRSGLGDDLLRIGGIKVFADGALGPRTAAMVEPYAGEPNNRGMLFLDAEQLFEHAQNAARGGLKMTVHAIGDRANHEVLNAYEQLRNFERSAGLPALRHRIEHVQILHPDDLQRLGKLHIIASMQPIHATSDMQAADEYWGERSQYAYSWRTQLEAGSVLAFGSDAPVESPNPWLGIHAAVTRRRADGSPGAEGWYPQQRLTLGEALAGFTTGPAYAAGAENKLGRLAPGYLADLIVMEQDPFSIDAHELQHLLPSAVMLGGEWVY
jgi:predicted amidohydrolase YtcJ